MTLIEEMGLDAETITWHSLALCIQSPTPNNYFDNYESDKVIASQIDEMCLSCPVMKQCLEAGQQNKERGVWGAIYWNGAGKPDANMNAHKTEAVWDRIREVIEE